MTRVYSIYYILGDGHGGREVALFVEKWLPKEARECGNPEDLSGTMVSLYNKYVFFIQYQSITI